MGDISEGVADTLQPVKKKYTKNQGFPYNFCLLIEGFGSGSGSIPLTNGSGSRRPKNMRIRWIRNTDRNESTNGPILKLRIETKPKRFDVFQNLKWNVSIHSKNFGTKPKLFDVFQLFLLKQNVSMYSKNFETKLFDVFQLFFLQKQNFLFFPNILE